MGIVVYDSIDSTNAQLLRQAAAGETEEGQWALAIVQTGGRGRQGRAWTSASGNLHASTVVRLRPGDPPSPTLSLVAAVALHRALGDPAIPAARLQIKWPNDLVVRRRHRWAKLAGILLEREGDAIVAGFGANLAYAPDIPGRETACAADLGAAPAPIDVCRTLGAAFADELNRWRTRGADETVRRWLDRAHAEGTALRVHASPGETVEGTFAGLAADGALRLATPDGERLIRAGDVDLG